MFWVCLVGFCFVGDNNLIIIVTIKRARSKNPITIPPRTTYAVVRCLLYNNIIYSRGVEFNSQWTVQYYNWLIIDWLIDGCWIKRIKWGWNIQLHWYNYIWRLLLWTSPHSHAPQPRMQFYAFLGSLWFTFYLILIHQKCNLKHIKVGGGLCICVYTFVKS